MSRALASDNCPGVLRLHEAADGHLARVRPPGGRIAAPGLRVVADLAETGNGIVELTSRANLQVRGLDAAAGPAAAALLAAAGLLPSPAHERVRNILASPVSGRHPRSRAATDALVVDLDRAICADPALTQLSGRFLFAVDDGAGLLGGRAANVTLRATSSDTFELLVAGMPTGQAATRAAAPGLAVSAARRLMARDAPAGAAAAGDSLPLGRLHQLDGRTALTVLPPLGRLNPVVLRGLADLADHGVRIAPARTLTLPDVEPDAVEPLETALRSLGLVDDPASGWHGLSACAGLGACRRARHDVRAAAQRRAAERQADDPLEHWAACGRRCGRPPGPHIARTGTDDGIEHEVVQ